MYPAGILTFYASEEGQREFAQWKTSRRLKGSKTIRQRSSPEYMERVQQAEQPQ
jgi:hypothetical protein